MPIKLSSIPASQIVKKKRKVKTKKSKSKDGKIFGLRKCTKCLQTKTLPNFEGNSFICDTCDRNIDSRGYADYIEEAKVYESWKLKYPDQKPCQRCHGIFPPYVMSMEFGKYLCANCYLITDEEEKEDDKRRRDNLRIAES